MDLLGNLAGLAGATLGALMDPVRWVVVGAAAVAWPKWWLAVFMGIAANQLLRAVIVLRAPPEWRLSILDWFPVAITSGAIIALLAWLLGRLVWRALKR
jgi:hypothetical protein